MTQLADILAPAIGACLSCRQLYLVTPETPNCILCGRAPAYTLPFPLVPPGIAEPAPVEPVEPIPPTAPSEELSPAAEEPPPAAAEEAPEEAPETIKASELLPVVIAAFLVGDVAVDEEQLEGIFEDVGVDPEAASTAVGRLSAVRELLQALEPPREAAPVAAAPSEAESSPENT